MVDVRNEEWRTKAACKKLALSERERMNFMYPYERRGPKVIEPKKVCDDCPVEEECLNFALLTKQCDGIWGGLTLPERKTLLRKMRKEGKLT